MEKTRSGGIELGALARMAVLEDAASILVVESVLALLLFLLLVLLADRVHPVGGAELHRLGARHGWPCVAVDVNEDPRHRDEA